jgi:hypothetical protein
VSDGSCGEQEPSPRPLVSPTRLASCMAKGCSQMVGEQGRMGGRCGWTLVGSLLDELRVDRQGSLSW